MSHSAAFHSFEEYAQRLTEAFTVPGASIGLAKDGQLVYEKQLGYRDVENRLPVTIDTVFGIASMTKSFTCLAIMQLQEAGKLSVHAPVMTYLPEFRLKAAGAAERMTIHHLMTHSTGLPPLATALLAAKRSMELDPDQSEDERELLAVGEMIDTHAQLFDYLEGLDIELLGPPGTQFSYSNDSYALLGLIVERVSGQRYEDYVKEHILQPAGMDRSGFFLEEADDNVTSLYIQKVIDGSKQPYPSNYWPDSPLFRASGFLKSTVRDILKYADIYRTKGLAGGERIVSEESINQMITPHIACEPGCYYGYGLMLTPDYFGTLLVEHSGSLKGVASKMYVIPEQGITGAALTNLYGSPVAALLNGACNAYAGRLSSASLRLPDATWARGRVHGRVFLERRHGGSHGMDRRQARAHNG